MAVHTIFTTVILVLLAFITCSRVRVYADTKHAYRAEANGPETAVEECLEHSDAESCHKVEEDGLDDEVVGANGSERVDNGDVLSSIDEGGTIKWDPKGYVMFCPCMGRFGNQGEHYLGALAFAKALDRTLVLPPFRTFVSTGRKSHASYGELFEVEPIREFHRTILMEDFMEHLASKYWPAGKRVGYCHLPEKSEMACTLKQGNPFGPFWDHFNIDFDDHIKYQIHNFADISNENSMRSTKREWDARFPPEEHPVLALRGSPGSYPMLAGNRDLQKYLRWAPAFFADAGKYIRETFGGEAYVGIHLRNGIDWERACEHAEGVRRFMASPQCLEKTPELMVTKDLCLPGLPQILELTLDVFRQVQAKHLYIATDNQPHTGDFKELLHPLGISVHYLKPSRAEMDLMILGKADYFIGNCISSFTSFIKRERDANGRRSTFWGQDFIL